MVNNYKVPSLATLFLSRLMHWEYWPFQVVYLPIFFYWIYLSIKARSMFFFTSSNPLIETGGLIGESKIKILNSIPQDYKPFTTIVAPENALININQMLEDKKIQFPFICKPDIGERGTLVEKINNQLELRTYMKRVKVDFIVQEFIEFPIEAGIFYFRLPGTSKGDITSIVLKEFLKVEGDGKSTIHELMYKNERARFQIKRFLKEKKELINQIPNDGEKVLLEPIGNHCRGTLFQNGNYLIDQELKNTFDIISNNIPGFYYGRYDLKCKSIHDLKQGKNIRIMELNGAGSEPAHIYHPGFSLYKAYKVLFYHWHILYKISKLNHLNGYTYMTFKEGFSWLKRSKNYASLLAKSNNG